MKKFTLFAAILGLAVAANAQGLKGVGYDAQLNQVKARIGLSQNAAIDVGLGFKLYMGDSTVTGVGTTAPKADHANADPVAKDAKTQYSLSAFYLGHLQHWGPVDNYLDVGFVFQGLPKKYASHTLDLIAGFQPEVTLLDHIVLSTRFGLDVPVMPDILIQTAGQGISIIGGASFLILF